MGADQVDSSVQSPEQRQDADIEVLTIVRDYRLRREMFVIERGFQTAGRVGFLIALGLGGTTTFALVRSIREAQFLGARVTWSDPIYIYGALLILNATAFGWCCRGVRGGKRWACWIFSLECVPPLVCAGASYEESGSIYAVAASSILILLMFWRPRGRFFFSQAYRELVERTPAETVSSETGRSWATLLLTSLIVIQTMNGLWLLKLLDHFFGSRLSG